ncbi:6-phosphogluconolactonase [Legionella maioricensis]|uniref:6-phosphogluconolactonase n=1 Tax=Legionella maioricensis TaxID=2896528 RepID=A0A9X2CZX9_9GAMM|nr:6-phosphogluconolactonase [Legionella maioricensis]MCL9683292.1 6-phosphogluconolactonase [Legionella maioricensis]MCL9686012.1 6-phosphogluconolactonase [Legionella maioricensis]
MQFHSFEDANLLNSTLAQQIKEVLENAVKKRGHAYLVVSGGKTPVELFKILAQTKISWDKITITLADERCVDAEHNDRNERLVKHFLLQHEARKAKFLSLYDEHIHSAESLQKTTYAIASLPTFDVVILGMGEDGHTASLFPCSNELAQGLDDDAGAVLFVTPQTAPHQRVSLSKKRLLDSRVIFLHLVGQKKRSVFNQALAEHNPMLMPVSAFLNNLNANVQVMYAP